MLEDWEVDWPAYEAAMTAYERAATAALRAAVELGNARLAEEGLADKWQFLLKRDDALLRTRRWVAADSGGDLHWGHEGSGNPGMMDWVAVYYTDRDLPADVRRIWDEVRARKRAGVPGYPDPDDYPLPDEERARMRAEWAEAEARRERWLAAERALWVGADEARQAQAWRDMRQMAERATGARSAAVRTTPPALSREAAMWARLGESIEEPAADAARVRVRVEMDMHRERMRRSRNRRRQA